MDSPTGIGGGRVVHSYFLTVKSSYLTQLFLHM